MKDKELWDEMALRIIKLEMGKNLVKIPELAELMQMEQNAFRNKLNRASFSAGFFLKALNILNVKKIDLDGVYNPRENEKL